ncbi:MAG: EMC6 family protein [Candidatus Heimdallarchaeota archaeon]
MSKKKPTKKGSSSSKKEKGKEANLNEYEEEFNGEVEGETEKEDKVDYDEYELPDDFTHPDSDEEVDDDTLNYWQRRKKTFVDMDDYQRLYWIKILTGCILGLVLGLSGASTAWWLFLMLATYGVLAGGGMVLFKLKWHWKEILFSGFFPFLALFALFWTLIYTSIYAPSIAEWINMLVVTQTIVTNNQTLVTTYTNTTTAAGIPYLTFILIIVASLGFLQFMIRRVKRKNL